MRGMLMVILLYIGLIEEAIEDLRELTREGVGRDVK
jgi:hypothetical protein